MLDFGYRGNIGRGTFRIRTFLDGKHYTYFEDLMEDELKALRKTLNRIAGEQVLISMRSREILNHVFGDDRDIDAFDVYALYVYLGVHG